MKRLPVISLMMIFLYAGISLAGNGNVGKNPDIGKLLEQAMELLESDPKRASVLAGEALRKCDTSVPDSATIAAAILYGDAEQLLGNFDYSLHILRDAESIVGDNFPEWRAKIYMLEGRVFSKLGDYQKSSELNDKATSTFKALGDSASVAQCYYERGVMLLYLNENAPAEHFFERALDINRRLKIIDGIARNLNALCLYEGDTSKKLMFIEEAIAINKHLGNKWALGENLNNKAKQQIYAGRFNEAIATLQEARVFIDSVGAKELLCDNFEYMSLANAGNGNYRDAYKYLGEMSDLSRQLQKSTRIRNSELDLARKQVEDQKNAAIKQKQEYRIGILTRNIVILVSLLVLLVAVVVIRIIKTRHSRSLQLVEARHQLEMKAKEVDKLKIRQQELELENAQNMLDANQRELTTFAAFLKSRNEMTDKIKDLIKEGYRLDPSLMAAHLKKITALINSYRSNDTSGTTILMSVEEHNKDFLNRLTALHPDLTKGERNLALLIRGGLSTKEIAMLLGHELRTVNMNRYRLRKSLSLASEDSLEEYVKEI